MDAADKTRALWDTLAPPPIGQDEMARAARKLWRFALRKTFDGTITFTRRMRGGSFTMHMTSGFQMARLVRPDVTVGMSGGGDWITFVSCCAFWFAKMEGGDHAEVEYQCVREVIKRGWMDGRLKDPPPTVLTKGERAALKRRDTVVSIRKRIKAWGTKQKRATTALKKLHQQLKRMEKAHGHID